MAEKKITKREKFAMLRTLAEGNEMLVEFIDNEIALLDRKASKTATKADPCALAIKDAVFAIIEEKGRASIKEMIAHPAMIAVEDEFLAPKGERMTSQRVNGQVNPLVKGGALVRTEEKKVAFFSLPVEG